MTLSTALRAVLMLFLAGSIACSQPPPEPLPEAKVDAATPLIDAYLERYFQTFPSRATAAGRYDLDDRLEDLSPEALEAWGAFNRETAAGIRAAFEDAEAVPATLDDDGRLDLALLLRQADGVVLGLGEGRRATRDPLFWTGIASNATVFQLVRDDRPLAERLDLATRRATHLPRLVSQATIALESGAPSSRAPELFALAARQARASATFYREGFALAARDVRGEAAETLEARMAEVGAAASTALGALGDTLDTLGADAVGSPRLGDAYAARFRLVTGLEKSVLEVLAEAEAALVEKRREAMAFARSVGSEVFPGESSPGDDAALLRKLFARVGEDHAESVEAFVADYRRWLAESVAFVREHAVVTLPEPLTVHVSRSPSFFIGQGVGGVYPAGPYAPEADTLFYLPTPPDDATPSARAAFFRDFNRPFGRMITPHEMVPGHYLQLKYAARHPRKVRALFGDGVLIEGWGTFCERLMLDLGWGGPLDRAAHLKKQLENIARTIVDIRVHTAGMTREEVLAFVRDEALQDEHFAGNMWTRAITSSPQLTTYFLGYQQVTGLYEAVRAARGEAFDLRAFTDGVMAIGPVPAAQLRERLLADASVEGVRGGAAERTR